MSETTDRSALRELVIRLCILATGFGGGLAIDDQPEPTPELTMIWCCDGDECWPGESFQDCPDGTLQFWCVYGQSTPSSGADGESGWECFDQ